MRAGDYLKGSSFALHLIYEWSIETPTELLVDSPYLDDLDNISDCFDKTTKTRFRNASEPQYVKFGSTRDNDASCNIRFGQLKVSG